jgi:hypothetical protein
MAWGNTSAAICSIRIHWHRFATDAYSIRAHRHRLATAWTVFLLLFVVFARIGIASRRHEELLLLLFVIFVRIGIASRRPPGYGSRRRVRFVFT